MLNWLDNDILGDWLEAGEDKVSEKPDGSELDLNLDIDLNLTGWTIIQWYEIRMFHSPKLDWFEGEIKILKKY